jgi:ubiquinone/menaquinone biosynthesis C-methylase UbiE
MNNSPGSESARLERERDYHNKAFAEDVRKSLDKFYETIQSSRHAHWHALMPLAAGIKVLEYGCGPGSAAFDLARQGAHVVGIDISDVAIAQSTAKARAENLDIDFRRMNAEQLEFEDNSFDRIVGSAILHHLDLDKAYKELHRCLKPGGKAVFIEPTGHNPLLNWYRKLTPNLRTVDEKPMKSKDFRKASDYFIEVQVDYFNLFTTAAVIFRNRPYFRNLLTSLDRLDRWAFRWIPGLKCWGWMAVMILQKSRT